MKSEELRRSLRADVEKISSLRKLPPVHRIPKKTRNTGEQREKKRCFSNISQQQVEAVQRANLAEEAAARELLTQKTSLSKTSKTKEEASPALVSNVQGLSRVIPTLSARELKHLADSIKRRRLQLVRPTNPKPRERPLPHLERPQSARQETQPATGEIKDPIAPRPVIQKQQNEGEANEEQLLRRLLSSRRRTVSRVTEDNAAQPDVHQLADTLVSSSLRLVNFYFQEFMANV